MKDGVNSNWRLPLTAFLLLAGCASERDGTTVRFESATYLFPSRDIVSATMEPHRFVRIKPSGMQFELVHDSRTAGAADAAGRPAIFSLNEGEAPNIHWYEVGGQEVVCRRAVHPRGGCGLKLQHRGTEWTILFPPDHAPRARHIARRANELLDRYSL